MKKNKNIVKLLLAFFIILNACGFSKINKPNEKLFEVNKIFAKGDSKIGHDLKNEILLYSSKNSKNLIDINLDINKKKEVKERTVSKKITKYSIILTVSLDLENTIDGKRINQTFSKVVDFDATKNRSDTISNEKKTIENITQLIGEEIINFLIIYYR